MLRISLVVVATCVCFSASALGQCDSEAVGLEATNEADASAPETLGTAAATTGWVSSTIGDYPDGELGAWLWLFNAPSDEVWQEIPEKRWQPRPKGWGDGMLGWLDRLVVALTPHDYGF